MEFSKRYNSVNVKDNCALFAPIPYFRGRAIRRCYLNFSLPTFVAMVTNFETKIDYNSAPWKIIARCFHLHPYFRARAIRWRHLNFSPADPCCHCNEFLDKIDYNSAPWKIIAPCLHLSPYTQLLGYIAWQWSRQTPRSTERIFCSRKSNKSLKSLILGFKVIQGHWC